MANSIDLAEIAALVGDPARAAMVNALMDGRALTAGELAFLARVSPQTASLHLRKLSDTRICCRACSRAGTAIFASPRRWSRR